MTKKEPKLKYGFYSQQAVDKGFPTHIWKSPSGIEREVTGVYWDEEAETCKWTDKMFVGRVIEFVRQGRPDTTGKILYKERYS